MKVGEPSGSASPNIAEKWPAMTWRTRNKIMKKSERDCFTMNGKREDWLACSDDRKVMWCSVCRKEDKSGSSSFITGCKTMRIKLVRDHEKNGGHKKQILKKQAQKSPESATIVKSMMGVCSKLKELIEARFLTVFKICKTTSSYKVFPNRFAASRMIGRNRDINKVCQ